MPESQKQQPSPNAERSRAQASAATAATTTAAAQRPAAAMPTPNQMTDLRRAVRRKHNHGVAATARLVEPWVGIAKAHFEVSLGAWEAEAAVFGLTGDACQMPTGEDGDGELVETLTVDSLVKRLFGGTLGRLLASGYFGRAERVFLDPLLEGRPLPALWSLDSIAPLLDQLVAAYWNPLLAAAASGADVADAADAELLAGLLAGIDFHAGEASSAVRKTEAMERHDLASVVRVAYEPLTRHFLLANFHMAASSSEFERALADGQTPFLDPESAFLAKVAKEAFDQALAAGHSSPARARAGMLALLGASLFGTQGHLRARPIENAEWVHVSPSRWLDIASSTAQEREAKGPGWLSEAMSDAVLSARRAAEAAGGDGFLRNGSGDVLREDQAETLADWLEGFSDQYAECALAVSGIMRGIAADVARSAGASDPWRAIQALREKASKAVLVLFGQWLQQAAFSRVESLAALPELPRLGLGSFAASRGAAEIADLVADGLVEPILARLREELAAGRGIGRIAMPAELKAEIGDVFETWAANAGSQKEASAGMMWAAGSAQGENPEMLLNDLYPLIASANLASLLDSSLLEPVFCALVDSPLPNRDGEEGDAEDEVEESVVASETRDAILALRDQALAAKEAGEFDQAQRRALALLCLARVLSLGQSSLGKFLRMAPRVVELPDGILTARSAVFAARVFWGGGAVGVYATALNNFADAFGRLAPAERAAHPGANGTASTADSVKSSAPAATVAPAATEKAAAAATKKASVAAPENDAPVAKPAATQKAGMGKEGSTTAKADSSTAPAASKRGLSAEGLSQMFSDDASHRSLAFFEERRLEIAKACAAAIKTTLDEFELREGCEPFHFLTTLIACGEWLAETGTEAIWARYSDDEDARETPAHAYARLKAVAGVIARLVMHPMALSLDPGDPMTPFMEAFVAVSTPANASADERRQRIVGIQIMGSAWGWCRGALFRAMLGHLNTGEIDALAHEHFEPFYEYLEGIDRLKDHCNIYPRGAEKDAYAQLLRELTFLLDRSDALPIILPVTTAEQRTPAIAQHILLRYLPQFTLFRLSMELREGRFERSERTFSDALASVGTPGAFALFDCCNTGRDGGRDEAGLFLCQDESCSSYFRQVIAGAVGSGVQPVLLDLRVV